MSSQFKYFLLFLFLSAYQYTNVSCKESSDKQNSGEISEDSSNETVPQDLYVIKTVVYEVGILTDAANDTDLNDTETHEQVDLSIYDPSRNGSLIDLSSIPVPIQTNVSGVEITGVLPSNLGSILLPANGSEPELNTTIPVLPDKQVKVTQNISTTNPERGNLIISNLSKLLGLHQSLIKMQNTTSNKEEDEGEED